MRRNRNGIWSALAYDDRFVFNSRINTSYARGCYFQNSIIHFLKQIYMATYNKGILGSFSGTVGTVVGGSWRGIDYMRSKPTIRQGSSSVTQDVQRAKFALTAKFLRAIKPLLDISFKEFGSKMTGSNSALSYTIKNAIKGDYPDLQIDYSLV